MAARLLIVGLCAASLALGAGLKAVWDRTSSAPYKVSADMLQYADGGSTLSALVYVAYNQTFFHTEGLGVHYTPHTSGRDALGSLLAGKVQIATVADTPIVRAMLRGEKFKIVATIGTTSRSTAIVVNRRIETPKDIIGQKIGYIPGTNAEHFLDEFLIKHEIDADLVSRVPLAVEEVIPALTEGRIAGVSIFDPYLSRFHSTLKDEIRTFYAPEIYIHPWNVVVSEELASHPGIIDRFLRALIVAEQFVFANPDIAKEITAKYMRVSAQEIEAIWPNLKFNVSLDQSLVFSLERQLLQKVASPDEAPDILSYFLVDNIERIQPDRLTIIR